MNFYFKISAKKEGHFVKELRELGYITKCPSILKLYILFKINASHIFRKFDRFYYFSI